MDRSGINKIMELKARGACVVAVVDEGDEEIKGLVDDYVCVPGGVSSLLSPIPLPNKKVTHLKACI